MDTAQLGGQSETDGAPTLAELMLAEMSAFQTTAQFNTKENKHD